MLRKSVLLPTRGNHDRPQRRRARSTTATTPCPRTARPAASPRAPRPTTPSTTATSTSSASTRSASSRSATGAMATWLRNDLAANTQTGPSPTGTTRPTSKGSHDSDTESELIEMRQNINPILEEGGVDLVLSGHSHAYERSFFLDGHYGTSATLRRRPPTSCSRQRARGRQRRLHQELDHPHRPRGHGLRRGRQLGPDQRRLLNHPAMFISLNMLGLAGARHRRQPAGRQVPAQAPGPSTTTSPSSRAVAVVARRRRPPTWAPAAGQRPGRPHLERRRRRRQLQRQAQHHQRWPLQPRSRPASPPPRSPTPRSANGTTYYYVVIGREQRGPGGPNSSSGERHALGARRQPPDSPADGDRHGAGQHLRSPAPRSRRGRTALPGGHRAQAVVAVNAVSGLGLTWTRVAGPVCGTQADRRRGLAGDGHAIGQRAGDRDPGRGARATRSSPCRATRRPAGSGASSSANTNGAGGACSGGTDSSAYSVNLTTTTANSLRFGAVAIRNRTHTPGAGYTERVEVRGGNGGTETAGLAIEDRTGRPPSARRAGQRHAERHGDWAVVGRRDQADAARLLAACLHAEKNRPVFR